MCDGDREQENDFLLAAQSVTALVALTGFLFMSGFVCLIGSLILTLEII